jgi:hypothetical protein
VDEITKKILHKKGIGVSPSSEAGYATEAPAPAPATGKAGKKAAHAAD